MKLTTKQLTTSAIFAALTFVVTRFIQIPIPLGYFNIGNTVILASCVLLPSPCGILVGAIGSALADLTSYPVYTIPTLLIKALFPFLYYVLVKAKLPQILSAAISTLIPLFGYTLTGCILYGFAAGLAQFPGLLLEYVANLILFAVVFATIKNYRKVKTA